MRVIGKTAGVVEVADRQSHVVKGVCSLCMVGRDPRKVCVTQTFESPQAIRVIKNLPTALTATKTTSQSK